MGLVSVCARVCLSACVCVRVRVRVGVRLVVGSMSESTSSSGESLTEPLGEAVLYKNASRGRPEEWFDWENMELKWGSVEPYHVVGKLGRGHFGEVFSAIDVRKEARRRKKKAASGGEGGGGGKEEEELGEVDSEKAAEELLLRESTVVAKVLKPVSDSIIKREVKFLQNLSGGTNIIKLLDLVMEPVTRTKSLIFEYVDTPDFKKMFLTFTDEDARFYMYHLLLALDYTHAKGVIHRGREAPQRAH